MTAPIAHGGGVTAAAALYGGKPADWLDLSTGINPCPVEIPALDPAVWHRLPDRFLEDAARQAAGRYYNSGQILPLPVPGTQSVIQLLPKLVEAGRRVAIFAPTYGEYRRVFEMAGFAVDAVTSPEQIRPAHGLVIVVNPNNPDGRLLSPKTLVSLWQSLRAQNAMLLVDEAFGDCLPEASIASRVEEMPGLMVFRSFGKFFGLAGLRLGFVIAEPSLQQHFADGLGPWAVSGPALALADHFLRGDEDVIRDGIAQRSTALRLVLQEAGLTVVGGTALFALVADENAGALHRHLCARRILVRPFDYAPSWLRFGLTPDAGADERLATALSQWR
jgi:cobalamin biosynthetic protein CobC